MKIAYITSECVPFASTGGLGEVSSALPRALVQNGHEVIVILPLYRPVQEGGFDLVDPGLSFKVPVGLNARSVEVRLLHQHGVTVYFVGRDEYFDRRELYSLPHRDYEDNFERFVFFQKAAVELLDRIEFGADIVQANDWQTGLMPAFLHYGVHGQGRICNEGTVFSIHNLAYQGIFPSTLFSITNLPFSQFTVSGMEYYGQVSCMKAGIVGADRIATVSQSYAHQIQTESVGCGLHGVLSERSERLVGIINGIDYTEWNPSADANLPAEYDADSAGSGKRACKEALADELGLHATGDDLWIGMVTRLDELKGLDLLAEVIPEIMQRNAKLVLLGSGRVEYHQLCERWTKRWPTQFACRLEFDPALAHRIFGGVDAFLMPSRIEPCGLGQLQSMRYGAVPVVHATGGLADSVADLNGSGTRGTGFRFSTYNTQGLLGAVDRALALYADPDAWHKVVRRIMKLDLSWDQSARDYTAMYAGVLAARKV